MSQTQPDNRRTARESLRIPVRLETSLRASDAPIFGYTSDISGHGLKIMLSSSIDEIACDLLLNIDFPGSVTPLKVPVKLVWSSHVESGFEFQENIGLVLELLKRSIPAISKPINNLKKFYPYVGDEDIDTGKYEFFPYADKYISDNKKVRDYIFQLKNNILPINVEQYIYSQYAYGDSDLNKSAIDLAHSAFLSFSKFSLERRRKIFDDARELLLKEKETIINLMMIEGHPRKLAEWEYSGMVSTITPESLDYFQSQIMQTTYSDKDETVIHLRRPFGVVCVSTPRNASSIGFMAALSLFVGNTLIIKPPIQMPLCSIYMWRNIYGRALKDNGAPRGTVNIVYGNSRQFMNDWLTSSKVKCILFFGDSEKGLEIGKKIYEAGKRPILELSGNDHMLVWKDAPIDESTDSLLDAFMGSTQICMVPKKAIIHEDIFDEFVSEFMVKVGKLKIGLPSDPETVLSPVSKINEFYEQLNQALQNGAELLCGGHRLNHLGEIDDNGCYIAPTVLSVPAERASMMKCVSNENFFPLIPLIKVTGGGLSTNEKDNYIFKRIIEILNYNEYGLRISAWVNDKIFMRKFIDEATQSGLLRINSRHIGFSHGLSVNGGIGKSGGPYGEMNHVWQKTSHVQGISVKKVHANTISSEAESRILTISDN